MDRCTAIELIYAGVLGLVIGEAFDDSIMRCDAKAIG